MQNQEKERPGKGADSKSGYEIMVQSISTRRRSNSLWFETLEQREMLSATSIGDESLVNDFVIREQSIENSSMAVAVSSMNSIIVFEGKGPKDRQGVFAKVSDSANSNGEVSFGVNSTIHGSQHSPTVAADREGNFIVAWAGRGLGDKRGVFFQQFDSTGIAIGNETLANETVGGKQSEPTIAIASDGSFVVAWSGLGKDDFSGVFLRRFDTKGTATDGEERINTSTNDQQTSPSITFESSGRLVATWQSRHQDGSDWGVYGQWFESDGARLGEEIRLNETTADSQSSPFITDDPTAGVVVSWQSRNQDGDSWGVVAREFDSSGNATSNEILLNDQTDGHQQDVSIAIAQDGQWLTTWASGVPDGSGWEIVSRSFEADGTANDSKKVNIERGGANSGHQQAPAVALSGDQALIAWSGNGAEDHHGVFAQPYKVESNGSDQQSPNLVPISNRDADVGTPIEILVTATDPNLLDTLTFFLDVDNSPTDAVLEQIDNRSARIRWTPPQPTLGQSVPFRVLVSDDGEPALVDSEDFLVLVGEASSDSGLSEAIVDEAFASIG